MKAKIKNFELAIIKNIRDFEKSDLILRCLESAEIEIKEKQIIATFESFDDYRDFEPFFNDSKTVLFLIKAMKSHIDEYDGVSFVSILKGTEQNWILNPFSLICL